RVRSRRHHRDHDGAADRPDRRKNERAGVSAGMKPPSRLPALGCAAVAALYGIVFLHAESQLAVGALLVAATAGLALAARFGLIVRVRDSIGAHPATFDAAAMVGALATAV